MHCHELYLYHINIWEEGKISQMLFLVIQCSILPSPATTTSLINKVKSPLSAKCKWIFIKSRIYGWHVVFDCIHLIALPVSAWLISLGLFLWTKHNNHPAPPASAKVCGIACRVLTSSILFPQQGEMWFCHVCLSPASVKRAPCRDTSAPRQWWVQPSCHTTRRLLIWFELAVFMLFNRLFVAMCHSPQSVTSTDWVHTDREFIMVV